MKYTFSLLEDKTTWNEFVESFPTFENKIPKVTFVQSYEWIEFNKSLGRNILNLGIYQNQELIGVGVGVIIRAKRGSYLYFRQGPIIDWSKDELVKELLTYLKQYCVENKIWFIRTSPMLSRNDVVSKEYLQNPKSPMHDVEALDTWIMNLDGSEEEIFNTIRKKTRYEIRTASKEGLEAVIVNYQTGFEEFYKILKDTVQRQGWNSYSSEYIKKEFESFNKDKRADILLIKYNNKYIAGGIFIHFANQTFYHYGASLTEFNNLPGAYLLMWEAIKLAKEKGNSFFNFWGVSPENNLKHPWYGLSKFKRKFPGIEINCLETRDIPVSKLYFLTNIFERFDKYRKGY